MSALTDIQRLGQEFDAGWRDIASAPKDYSDLLVFAPENDGDNNNGVSIGWFDVDDAAWYTHDIQQPARINPTHWMPLPYPPVAAGVVPADWEA